MSHRRVLVVDDDRSNRTLVAKLLTDHGFAVDAAADGPSALELVSSHDYDCVVLDYEMPMMNGVELFREIRQMHPRMPGIFLTAFTTIDTVYPAIESGVERVLGKPVDPRELIPVVDEFSRKDDEYGE